MGITMNWNRILSALVAVIYFVGAFVAGGGETGCKALSFVIFPLACIWFSDAMGGYTGVWISWPITATSPGVIVCILGWLVLLMPLFILVIVYAAG